MRTLCFSGGFDGVLEMVTGVLEGLGGFQGSYKGFWKVSGALQGPTELFLGVLRR